MSSSTLALASTATTFIKTTTTNKKKRKGNDDSDDDDVVITKVKLAKVASSVDRKDELKQFRDNKEWTIEALSPCVQIPFEDPNLLEVSKAIGFIVFSSTNGTIPRDVCEHTIAGYLSIPEALLKGLEVMRYRGLSAFQRMWCLFLYVAHFPDIGHDLIPGGGDITETRKSHKQAMNVFAYFEELLPQLTHQNDGLLDISGKMAYFFDPVNDYYDAVDQTAVPPADAQFNREALKLFTKQHLLVNGDMLSSRPFDERLSLKLFNELSDLIGEGLSYAAFRLPLVKLLCQSGWLGDTAETHSVLLQHHEDAEVVDSVLIKTFQLGDPNAFQYLYGFLQKLEGDTEVVEVLKRQMDSLSFDHYLVTSREHRVNLQWDNLRYLHTHNHSEMLLVHLVDIHEALEHNDPAKDIKENTTVVEELAQSDDISLGIPIRDPSTFRTIFTAICPNCDGWVEEICDKCGFCTNREELCCTCGNDDDDDDPRPKCRYCDEPQDKVCDECKCCDQCCETDGCKSGSETALRVACKRTLAKDEKEDVCICTEQSQGQCSVHNPAAASCKRCHAPPDFFCDCVCGSCKGKPNDPCRCDDGDEDL